MAGAEFNPDRVSLLVLTSMQTGIHLASTSETKDQVYDHRWRLITHMIGNALLPSHEMSYEESEAVNTCRRAIAAQYPELGPADVEAALPSQKLLKFPGVMENWVGRVVAAGGFQSTYAIAPLGEAERPVLSNPVESLADVVGPARMISADPDNPNAAAQIAEVLRNLTNPPPENPYA